jgi:hypothetical protein
VSREKNKTIIMKKIAISSFLFITLISLLSSFSSPKKTQEVYSFRSLLTSSQTGTMEVTTNEDGTATITSSTDDVAPNDIPTCGGIGMTLQQVDRKVVINIEPNKTYWWIPFGSNQTPEMVYNGAGGSGNGGGSGGSGGGSSEVTCHCGSISGPTTGCTTMTNTATCKMYCTTANPTPCESGCNMVITICSIVKSGTGVLIEASSVNYNGQQYSN